MAKRVVDAKRFSQAPRRDPNRQVITGPLARVQWNDLAPVSTLQDRLPWMIAVGFAGLLAIQAVLVF